MILSHVTPCVGVWIETPEYLTYYAVISSHPAWVCGLKLYCEGKTNVPIRHTLRGCVDWNPEIDEEQQIVAVTPCVGVWIETMTTQSIIILT